MLVYEYMINGSLNSFIFGMDPTEELCIYVVKINLMIEYPLTA